MGGEHESSPLAIDFATDWTGLDDPDNPRNFHRKTRIYSTVSVTVLAFVTTFAASIYSPGIEGVSAEFNVSHSVAVLPLSLYNLGLAAGPLLGSPLSETWGRKIVLLITTPGFMVFTMGAALSGDIVSLTVCPLGVKERCQWPFTTLFPRLGLHWGLWSEALWYKLVAGDGPNGLY
jgi:MFS family permease